MTEPSFSTLVDIEATPVELSVSSVSFFLLSLNLALLWLGSRAERRARASRFAALGLVEHPHALL